MFGNLLGKLTLADIPFDQPIIMGAAAFMALIVVAVVVGLTWSGKWGYLWREWLTSVDHKKIGVMYIVVAVLMLLRGFVDALMMRTQLALAYNGPGFLPPEHYNQVFTAHGVIMIFFMAMAFMIGLMNIVVPLQIGARDVAFPFINSLSFWMTAVAAILINVSLVIGDFAQTGWLAYPPLSELQFSPGVGVDYYLWSLQLSGIGTLLTGVNFFVTIIKMRAPGMTYMKMPVFVDVAVLERADSRHVPDPDRNARIARARPLSRHALLHERCRRQCHALSEPDLGLGASGGVHPGIAGVRHLFGSRRDVRQEAAVWLQDNGLRHVLDHGAVVAGLVASLLHHGFRRERECVLRDHDHDHRHSDRREDLQLAVHHL
ncbi:Cytochrome O ubiquinol oxidase subunit I [Caballeronia sordidicola]|uniref:Cytochrome O ubiquinol oxidase subunit I n=1 Tax=Caballeronia sordidicola TaxID=196367 RepID=A0A242MWL9_CABSO|nr:Cytochrome O ubiquinol oxidase subunit I [Caballeronia sordidicola]